MLLSLPRRVLSRRVLSRRVLSRRVLSRRVRAFARALPLVALPLFALGATPALAEDPPDLGTMLTQGLKTLKLGAGIQSEQIIIFPVYVEEAPPPLDLRPVVAGTSLVFVEPEKAKQRDDLRVTNHGEMDALLVGGTVLEGGTRDRIVRQGVVIPAGKSVDVPTIPASMSSDIRKVAAPFVLAEFLAPPYLREGAQFGTSRNIVPTFVSHFLEFRNEKDPRKSLAAVGQSERLAQYCLVCHQSASAWPKRKDAATVIGGILVVRGRVQAMEVFATNDLMRAFFEPVLKSLSFPAAAIELRAKKAGIPLPGKDVPEQQMLQATAAARKLLETVQEGSFHREKESETGASESWVLSSGGTRGRVLAWKGRFVHMVVFPADPFEYALYAKPLEPLSPEDIMSDEDRQGLAELARRAAMGARLTEAEQRVLDRLGGALGAGGGLPRRR